MIFDMLIKTLRTITRPYFFKLTGLSVLVTAIGFGIFFGGAYLTIDTTELVSTSWVEDTLDVALKFSVIWIAWLLFPIFLPIVAAILQDFVAAAVEKNEYPAVKPLKKVQLIDMLIQASSFFFWALVINFICVFFIFIPPVYLFFYYVLNSYLLGREFFDMITIRHMDRKAANALRKDNRLYLILAGGVILFLSLTPVLNLFTPLLAMVIMVHLFMKVSTNR